MSMQNNKLNYTLKDKIAGSIYGFAIGDAMGATTEFMSKEQIKRNFGKVTDIIGGGWLNLKPGEVTDDTQMTMCVMDALMNSKRKLFKEHCINNFIEWYKTDPKDVGGQCARGITYTMNTNHFIGVDNSALGNGSLMRAMPCALLNEPNLNVVQGVLTHNNQKCSRFILEYTRLIQNLLYNEFYNINIKVLLEPSGYIVNTFNNSLCWLSENTFEEAIIGAVNHGGDADTIAAITGSLAGAKFGYNQIPKRWIKQLDSYIKNYLEKFKIFVFNSVQT